MAITSDRPLKIASLKDILATRFRATYSHRVNFSKVGYENMPKMTQWCKDHCEGKWREESYHALYWQFELEKDATMFMLRWSGVNGNQLK